MPASKTITRPAIIVISSHVVRGTVGNRAAAFALEVMGYPVWCIPTVTLPWHPGHGPATRITPPDDAFADMLRDLGNSPKLKEVGAILTGYLGSAGQVEPVADLINAVKAQNREAIYALDPVIGDGASLYVPETQAQAIKNTLLPLADLVTPNRFELEWLSGHRELDTPDKTIGACAALNVSQVLATSAPAMMRGSTGNLLLSAGTATMAEHRILDGPPNGLGDLTAALMIGHLLANTDAKAALRATTASVYEVMCASAQAGTDELVLERNIQSLLHPRMDVQIRALHWENKTP